LNDLYQFYSAKATEKKILGTGKDGEIWIGFFNSIQPYYRKFQFDISEFSRYLFSDNLSQVAIGDFNVGKAQMPFSLR